MATVIFFILTVLQAICLVLALRNLQKTRAWYEVLPALIIAGLVYDNAVITLGSVIGEGSLLATLNAGRFIIHALFTPLLIIWGFGVARRIGLGWAQSRNMHAIFCIIAVALMLLGAYNDIVRLSLELRLEDGLVRYVNVGGMKGPPIPSIVTIIVLFGIGVSIWRAKKSWGLAAGAAAMFICAMLGLRYLPISNFGEVLMSAGVLAGEQDVLRDGQTVPVRQFGNTPVTA